MKTEHTKNLYGTGLLPLPRDEEVHGGVKRDLSHTAVFGAVPLSKLPTNDFIVAQPLVIKDQGLLDFCGTFGGTAVSEDQEGVELDPLWQFAQVKKIKNDWKSWGSDLRSIGLSFVNVGSIEKCDAPFKQGEKSRDFLANWENYPRELEKLALKHKKASMFFVDGPHKTFDNIRMTLYMNLPEKRSILAGVLWRHSWDTAKDGVIPETGWEEESGEGHAVKIFGQKEINGSLRLVVQNSWGKAVGDKGLFYFPEKIINEQFGPFGQIMFKDMPVKDARYYQENGITIHDNWLVGIIKSLWNLFFNHT